MKSNLIPIRLLQASINFFKFLKFFNFHERFLQVNALSIECHMKTSFVPLFCAWACLGTSSRDQVRNRRPHLSIVYYSKTGRMDGMCMLVGRKTVGDATEVEHIISTFSQSRVRFSDTIVLLKWHDVKGHGVETQICNTGTVYKHLLWN